MPRTPRSAPLASSSKTTRLRCSAAHEAMWDSAARGTCICSRSGSAATNARCIGCWRPTRVARGAPAVIFTEYRDTLFTLESAIQRMRRLAVLHGGLTRQQRRTAIEAFNNGAADVLLATDAGSEGLNLQRRCRLVVNLELPWNPIRLEQRIGRVDRLGQSRTVHAINLFAHDTAESVVLARLVRRMNDIRKSLPSFDN